MDATRGGRVASVWVGERMEGRTEAQAVIRLGLPELNVLGWAPVEGALGITAIRRVGALSASEVYELYLESIPFSEFNVVSLTVGFGRNETANDSYRLGGDFEYTEAVDLLSEDVRISVGTSELTIPAGSFDQHGFRYNYEGTINGATVSAHFEDLGADAFAFAIQAESVDLTDTSNPVAVGLRIGNDLGETTERLQGILHGDNHVELPVSERLHRGGRYLR